MYWVDIFNIYHFFMFCVFICLNFLAIHTLFLSSFFLALILEVCILEAKSMPTVHGRAFFFFDGSRTDFISVILVS